MNVQEYKDRYIKWLKDEIHVEKVGSCCEVTAPFIDHNNDYIQFYIRQDGDKISFTDDGDILQTLEAEGLSLTAKRRAQINATLHQYGVKLERDSLTAESSSTDFPQKKHAFIQAMLKVDDLYMTFRSKASGVFTDDIAAFFKSNNIYCTPDIQLLGESGFSHNYDFLIQQSREMPTRLCVGINTPSRTNTENVLFSWLDTRQARKSEKDMLIVFLNDEHSIGKNVIEGLKAYDTHPILWSAVSSQLNLLTA